MQHFENIIGDTRKQTDKATLEGKPRQFKKAKILVFDALIYLNPQQFLFNNPKRRCQHN